MALDAYEVEAILLDNAAQGDVMPDLFLDVLRRGLAFGRDPAHVGGHPGVGALDLFFIDSPRAPDQFELVDLFRIHAEAPHPVRRVGHAGIHADAAASDDAVHAALEPGNGARGPAEGREPRLKSRFFERIAP